MSQKTKKKKHLKYTCWRKNKHGVMQPYVILNYADIDGKTKKLEAKMNEYTFDEVVRLRDELNQFLVIKRNHQQFGVTTIEISIKQAFEKWLEYKKRKVRAYTVKRYKSIIDNHILPILEDYPVRLLDRKLIQNILNDLIDKKLNRTAQFVHRIFSNFCKFAVIEKYFQISPFENIDYPIYQKREIEVLTKFEAKKFLKLCQTSKHALLFEFALITGMRPEEYLALQWSDFDFENKIVIVQRSVDLGIPETTNFQDVKSANSRRKIPLPLNLFLKLNEHYQKQKKAVKNKEIKFKKNNKVSKPLIYQNYNLVFPSENGTPLRLNNLTNRHFKPLIEKITNKNIHLYSLRHTTATLLLIAGENPKVVAERLGNTVEVTLNTYSHVSPNMQKSASEKLEAMLK